MEVRRLADVVSFEKQKITDSKNSWLKIQEDLCPPIA
jgi:hypothetical protein